MKQEIWKDLPGYDGYYQVSTLGQVKTTSNDKTRKERVLKPTLNGPNRKKYLAICLTKNRKQKTIKIHQLGAMTFLNHIPCGHKIVVDHIDNNPLNNNVENLQLVSNRENSSKNRIGGTSKYIGVCWNIQKQKWNSEITINNKKVLLGQFKNELDAHLAYQNKLKSLKIIINS
jgi:hypothetical protein